MPGKNTVGMAFIAHCFPFQLSCGYYEYFR
jgi:hypothetical protein